MSRKMMGVAMMAAVYASLAAASTGPAAWQPQAVVESYRAASPRWGKLRRTSTTVAAMKRHARKRRNVRARSSKRGAQ